MNETLTALLDHIRAIKSPAMRTNAVFTTSALEEMIEVRDAHIILGENVTLILEPDTENIMRLYFYARDQHALKEIASFLPTVEERIVCDVVGREPKAGVLATELAQAGFTFYAKFQRMLCSTPRPDMQLDISHVEAACPEDADEILEITHEAFDPLTAHIPARDALIARIKAEEVFILRCDGKIAGFTSFDSRSKRVALLDHVIVRPAYRKQSIAKKILTYKWRCKNESEHYILWINEQCKGPISYHEKNGFARDGMFDYILTM